MTPSRRILGALAVAGLLGTTGLRAQELDATIKGDGMGHPAILRDDIEGEAADVGHLQEGDPVTVYLQISSPDYYFVKRKGSVPGQGSGWVPRSQVNLARAEDEARQAAPESEPYRAHAINGEMGAPPTSTFESRYHAIVSEMAAAPAEAMRRIAESKRTEITDNHAASPLSADTKAKTPQGVPAEIAARAPAVPTAPAAGPVPAEAASVTTDGWDIPKGHWARAAVEELASAGLLRVPNGKFEGETTVNRYEMALLAQRIVAHSRESCTVLAQQLQKLGDASGETRQKVDKLSDRMESVEHKVARLAATASKQAAGPSTVEVKELAKNVTSLRQTFTRSIAELALDRSKVEQFRGSFQELMARIERLEKRAATFDRKA